ncbi:hypothetical protein ACFP7A_10345 [Sporolactobacillus kofuensis]|uniref:Uncharacterized protein n=2 Tax=Sporolactobacillus kofuensis TaxID=269672 RepID=A0ABW1WI41_9BACL
MSFVSIIATDHWISTVSDGNLVEFSEKGTWAIRPGQKQNYVQISQRQCIVCTGSAELWERIKKMFPYTQERYVLEQDLFGKLKEIISLVPAERQDVLVAILDAQEQVICHMISNQTGAEWTQIQPTSRRMGTLFLAGRMIDEQKIQQIAEEFNRLLQVFGKNDPRQVMLAQKELNKYVTVLDPTVGQRVFHLLIKKD